MPQNDFVEVTLNLQPASAATATLDTAMLIHSLTDAQDQAFGGPRFKLLTAETWPDDLAGLGITDGEAAYEDVQAHFGQFNVPDRAYLGRRGKDIAQVHTVVVPGVPADGNYTIVVSQNGVPAVGSPYNFAAVAATQAAVRTALVTACGAGSAMFAVANGVGAGDIALTSVLPGVALTVSVVSPASSMTESVTTGTKVAAVAQVWTMDIGSAALGVYELIVSTSTGQKTYTHVAISGATATTIRDAIKALYDADPSDLFGATMASVSTDKGTLTASLAGRPGSVTITSPASDATVAVTTANYGIADDVTALIAANPNWYMAILGSHVKAEILLFAERIEATQGTTSPKAGLVQTSDADTLTDAADNVLELLQERSYLRVAGCYHSLNAEGFHAAAAGYVLPIPAGKVSWVAKPIVGLTPEDFASSSSSANIRSNEGWWLENFAARNQSVINGGYSFRGVPFDIIRAIDTFWLNASSALMDLLVNNLIVPYTNAGLSQARGVIKTAYNNAVSAGYAVEGTLVLSEPKISDATSNERSRGIFPEFVASFIIQAGAHKVRATFNVSQ